MDDSKWFTYVALALVGTVLVGVLAGTGVGVSGGATATPTGSAGGGGIADYVNLTIGWNPVSGLDEYFPANFTVPAHTLVVITITSYDNGTNAVPAEYAQVVGAVGGVETVTRGAASSVVSSVSLTGIAHTFTMMSMGGAPGSGPALNAVIPSAISASQPVSVQFETYFNSTGSFSWNCMAPCDPGAMMTPGLMAGTVSVV